MLLVSIISQKQALDHRNTKEQEILTSCRDTVTQKFLNSPLMLVQPLQCHTETWEIQNNEKTKSGDSQANSVFLAAATKPVLCNINITASFNLQGNNRDCET